MCQSFSLPCCPRTMTTSGLSRYDLAQRRHLQSLEMVADRVRDEARGDRRAVVVKDRHQADRIDAAFVDDQRAQLGVAVLFDHEHEVMVGDEAGHAGMERKGAYANPVERVTAGLDQVDRL